MALIGDHRNDENLLVAQTHLALLKFHNKVVDLLATRTNAAGRDLFVEARRVVTWHYQWMVLHDFVERITEDGIVARILHEGRKFYRFKKTPYMPVEFSAAAYRLGHSMVRQVYSHNRVFTAGGSFQPAVPVHRALRRDRRRSRAQPADRADADFGAAEQLDHRLAALLRLQDPAGRRPDAQPCPQHRSVPRRRHCTSCRAAEATSPFRNLKRGVNLGLPSGQDVAKAMQASRTR